MKSEQTIKLPIAYDLKVRYGSFSPESLRDIGLGGAEAILFGAGSYGANGRLMVKFFDGKGENQPLSPKDLYDAWISLGSAFLQSVNKNKNADVSQEQIERVMAVLMTEAISSTEVKENEDVSSQQGDRGDNQADSPTASGSEQTTDGNRPGERSSEPGARESDSGMV